MADLTGKQFGEYRIDGRLGRGGMATVYKAYQENLDRYVAIKIMATHYAEDPNFIERFKREAKAIARMQHPNILAVYNIGTLDEMIYIVMEYIDGGTLKEKINGAMPLDEAISILTQISSALDYAHQHGIVHRDIKPTNVLMNNDGRAVLADFGIAKLADTNSQLTGTGVGIGTPEYMSPEQAMGSQDVDGRSDIYSLAIMFIEMVTGKVPFSGENPMSVIMAHIQKPLPPLRTLKDDIPLSLETVLQKATAKTPADRYNTALEFAKAATNAIQGSAQTSAGTGEAQTQVLSQTNRAMQNEQSEQLARLWQAATAAEAANQLPQALDLYRQIAFQSPNYGDVVTRITRLQALVPNQPQNFYRSDPRNTMNAPLGQSSLPYPTAQAYGYGPPTQPQGGYSGPYTPPPGGRPPVQNSGPYPAGPQNSGPYPAGPQNSGPYPAGPQNSGPYPAATPISGPYPAARPKRSKLPLILGAGILLILVAIVGIVATVIILGNKTNTVQTNNTPTAISHPGDKVLADGYNKVLTGSLDDAAAIFSNAAKTDPDNANLHAGLAYVAILRHTKAGAQTALDELNIALKDDPNNARAHAFMALALVDPHQVDYTNPDALKTSYDKAKAEAQKAVTIDPNLADGQAAQAYINYAAIQDTQPNHDKSSFDSAADQARKAITLDSHSVNGYIALLNILDVQNKVSDFNDGTQTFVGFAPDLADAHDLRGTALYINSDYAGAGKEYQQAMTLNPDWAAPVSDNGWATYNQESNADNAVTLWQKAINMDPIQAIGAYEGLGQAAIDKSNYDEARQHYEDALKLYPIYTNVLADEGWTYINQTTPDYDKALTFFDRAVNSDKSSSYAYAARGWGHFEKKENDLAQQDWEQANRLSDRSFDAQMGLGFLLYDQAHYDQAEPHFQRATEILPHSGWAHRSLGADEYYLTNYAVARKEFNTALTINPNDTQAKQWVDKLDSEGH